MEKTENSTPYSPRYGEAETGGTGRLKIFFGYAAGVGKTYAMLERGLMYDWCLCNGDYSLAQYAKRVLPMMLAVYKDCDA